MPNEARALTEDEKAARRRASHDWTLHNCDGESHRALERGFEAGFIAGLRYRDGEPSDAEVEAAMQAISRETTLAMLGRRGETIDEQTRAIARAALTAARKARAPDTSHRRATLRHG